MSEQYGACVVLVPSATGFPDNNEIVGGYHVTLTYLGDAKLESVLEVELLQTAARLMDETRTDIRLRPIGIERFGEDGDAVVLTFDPHPESAAVLLRKLLLDSYSSELMFKFQKAETFPEYRPHMTLGYISDGFDPATVEGTPLPEFIHFKGISVWNGNDRTMLHSRHDEEVRHYGILRKSGRYPWGSGENPYQRSLAFYAAYNQLKAEGLSDTEIASYFGNQSTPATDFNTKMLRETRSLAKDQRRAGNRLTVLKLKAKGMSNNAIARQTNIPEPTVRSLLKDSVDERVNATQMIADKLRSQITPTSYIDVGSGNENRLGVSKERLGTAVSILRDEGYELMYHKEKQLGTNNETTIKFLAPPGSKGKINIRDYPERIQVIDFHSDDNGHTFTEPTPPKNFSSRKLQIAYDEDGGSLKDGVIELRRGVKDLDIGGNLYAQVRIAVDGTHYLKGMAVYADDLPDGVDIRFNTNKTRAEAPNKKDALKPLKIDKMTGEVDKIAPFGAQIKPGGQRGVLNIVNEAGDWDQWSNKLSSQMLSKQTPSLAKQQLNLTRDMKQAELDEINALTNPTVKKRLLEAFADGADASAVTLKAMGMPRTNNKVLLPIPSLKENEVYAPTYNDGEPVVLIRHPHGGRFEIPQLTVNNRNRNAKTVMGNAIDAIGINPRVAEQLSGADFDGDTVLVIPQKGQLKRSDPLKQLEEFNPRVMYKEQPGMVYMTKKNTQQEMGRISNLITDMTILGANNAEIARAVRHSMVVIDAEKHKLNYKLSELDNGIASLREKFQPEGGASTIISRAKGDDRIPEVRLARADEGGPIDPKTGELRWVETGKSYPEFKKDPVTGKKTIPVMVKDPVTGERVQKIKGAITKGTKMSLTNDANTLVSSAAKPMETIYADYANQMKAMANNARLSMINTPSMVRSPTAAKTYAPQVKSLVDQLNIALQNAPLERRAQIVGNAILRTRMEANPDMDGDEIKKERGRALNIARERTGANKTRINITPIEWEAIQAGALSESRLSQILNHADLDRVKELATPRTSTGIPAGALARAKAMKNAGHTWAEIASALGYSQSTLARAMKD